ncbi:MAG: RNA polymerase sigma factor [Bacteroidetes bacterium]|nr:RNA polymerase sigma factor [Bacteroidota bacterium]
MNERELISEIREGNSRQYRLLVAKYQQMIFRVCRGFVDQKEDAEDLAQEVFIKAYYALDSFDGRAAFSTWLYRIAINTCLNHQRKAGRSKLFVLLDKLSANDMQSARTKSDASPDAGRIMEVNDHATAIKKALAKLPAKQQTAFVLSKYEELPQQEIALIMETSVGAVEQLLQRAKQNLRGALAAYYQENCQ